jgi:hypothetical protein
VKNIDLPYYLGYNIINKIFYLPSKMNQGSSEARRKLQLTVKETDLFVDLWEELGMTDLQRDELKDYLCDNPEAGDIIPGTGGTRKLRWKLNNNKGKRGGQRVIYVYYKSYELIYLLMTYSKSVQENLTENEKEDLKGVTGEIKKILKDDEN